MIEKKRAHANGARRSVVMLERETAVSGDRTVDPTWNEIDPTWAEIDRNLRAIARRRAAPDVDEARWLVMARRALHRQFGFARLEEYLERVDVAVSHVGSNAGLAALIRAAFEALHARAAGDRASSEPPRREHVEGRRPPRTT